jgi:nucleoid-associated protein YgaU
VKRDISSRHQDLATYRAAVGRAGQEIELYVPRNPEVLAPSLQHKVVAGDRLDLLADRYFGDPFQYWRIVDANPAFAPEELLEPGRLLVIPGRP